jgi:lipid A ethanolaminephosphotransferase
MRDVWSRLPSRLALFAVQALAMLAVVALTNPGVPERIENLTREGKPVAIVAFAALWGLGLAGVLAAMLTPNKWARIGWAVVIALSAGGGYAFYIASDTELSIFDVVSLWSAAHEASRAMSFYQQSLAGALIVFAATLVLIALPPPLLPARVRRFARYLAILPFFPILAYAGLIASRDGDGSRALPAQFAPLSIAGLAGAKLATSSLPQREQVAWTPGKPLAKKVVMLIDESIRGDFIDFAPGNPYTPLIASEDSRLINYGLASSGGNCSHYSNAILRFGGVRHNLMASMTHNPTLWKFAKKAGYRTVFIDAQAAFMRNAGYSGKFQNFMSAAEAADIDDFYALTDNPTPHLDDKLVDVVVDELKGDKPVFIYAVKNGAHFPYDADYPPGAAPFQPTMTERGHNDVEARVNSYRNAIKWSVDRILKRLLDEANLKDTVIIYTSDHGQNLTGRGLTHCTIDDPNPGEGIVPLVAITDDTVLRARFAQGAQESFNHASHFEIAPTVLQLLGYPRPPVIAKYGPSMFDANREAAAFTSGDVFGLFSSKVRWHSVDLVAAAARMAHAEAKAESHLAAPTN